MVDKEKKEGILHQPVGELLKKDLTMPDALKKEIHAGEILKKELTISRKSEHPPASSGPGAKIACPSCGQPTPANAPRCPLCAASLLGHEVPKYRHAEPRSLIDYDWFGGMEDPATP